MKSPESKFTRLDQKVVAFTRWVLKWRWAVVGAMLLITLAVGSGGRFISFDTNYRAFFGKDNPQLITFEALQNIYTKNDNIMFVLAPNTEKVFEGEFLEAVEKLTAEAWKVPFALRVDAITNFQHTYAEDDDLIVENLVESATQQSPLKLAQAKQAAISEPFLINRLISPEAHVTAVNVTLQLPGKSITEVPAAVNYARNLADQIRAEHSEIEVYLTGLTMLDNAFSESSMDDLMTLVPLMYLIMTLVMFFFLRSVSATISTLVIITFSMITAMGLAGWFGVKLTPPSAQAPTIIMTLAIADSIHILVTMLREMAKGMKKQDAIIESIRVNIQPVFLTSVTTAIGFLTMNFSDVPPFHHLGNMTAAGIIIAFIYSVTLLPALVAILPVKARKQNESREFVDRLADFVIIRRRPLLWGSAAVVLGLAMFIPQNQLNDKFIDYFSDDIPFRTDTRFIQNNLTGVYQVEYSLGGGESGSISNPEYLQTVEDFANWFRQQPGVLHVNTFTDVMKRLNKNMNYDQPEFYSLPASRELAAQYLLLYEMSLPYGLDLNNQINVDKSATRFTVTLEDISAEEIRLTSERGEQWLKDNAPPEMFSYGSGPAVMFSYISGINITSMTYAGILALILISTILIFALRNLKMGFLSLVPNLVPIGMGLGIWALTSGMVNLGLSIVFGMTMGIVVDDTIHFLSKYLRARREQGMTSEAAVRYAFSHVGMALVVTTGILIAGFSILAFSSFDMNASMGKLTAITIGLALLADFLFLPPLLMLLDRKKPAQLVFTSKRKQAELVQPAFNPIKKSR